MILKTYAVAVIRASLCFPEKFIEYSKNHILDTIVRVYSYQFQNSVTRSTLEFILKQLFQLHRVPFVMELISGDLFNIPFLIIFVVCAEVLVATENCMANFVTPEIIHSLINSLSKAGFGKLSKVNA